eukprot:TRINITY_DN5523_c0_g1_i10.p1 TRINITY_DN5523_c0_g1~~TRINITY_DN5523_c0_g1_i10.p1  ORF type:complete len:204 (-),score=-13.96 TRINITY_DN5523_c0_g1_i10:16-627(-)
MNSQPQLAIRNGILTHTHKKGIKITAGQTQRTQYVPLIKYELQIFEQSRQIFLGEYWEKKAHKEKKKVSELKQKQGMTSAKNVSCIKFNHYMQHTFTLLTQSGRVAQPQKKNKTNTKLVKNKNEKQSSHQYSCRHVINISPNNKATTFIFNFNIYINNKQYIYIYIIAYIIYLNILKHHNLKTNTLQKGKQTKSPQVIDVTKN